jgi:hypothetical protein
MRAKQSRTLAAAAAATLIALSRVGWMPADMAAIAFDPAGQWQSESRVHIVTGTMKFEGSATLPARAM